MFVDNVNGIIPRQRYLYVLHTLWATSEALGRFKTCQVHCVRIADEIQTLKGYGGVWDSCFTFIREGFNGSVYYGRHFCGWGGVVNLR